MQTFALMFGCASLPGTDPGALASITAWILAASPGSSRHATPDRPGIAEVVTSTITVEWPHFIAALTGPNVVFLFPKEGWILFGRSRFADERDCNRFKTFVEDRWPIKPRFV